MPGLRLRACQVKRLRSADVAGSVIIESAVKRWQVREIVVQNDEDVKKSKNALQHYSIRNKEILDLGGAKIRRILDAHFNNPADFSKEIADLDKEIEALQYMAVQKKQTQLNKLTRRKENVD
jgi:hypothetical protein